MFIKITTRALLVSMFIVVGMIGASNATFAQAPQDPCEGLPPQYAQECRQNQADAEKETETPPSQTPAQGSTPTASGSATTGSDKLDSWLQDIINLLSGLVALVCVISLIFAGFQYMTAGGNASQVAAAKNRIVMVVLAFVVFVFGYGILQWLIPGGIFN